MRRIAASLAITVLVLLPADLLAQTRQLTGRVVAAETEAGISGAVLTVQGSTASTFTREEGTFTFRVPDRDITLRVSIIGYRSVETRVPRGQQSVTVQLPVDALALDELVVTGTATAISRQILPNAVSTLNSEELDRAPAETIERSMQGKVAGAVIEQNSGAPGGGMQVRLRGVSTINAASEPLYVVDGIVISNAAIPSNQNAVTAASSGSNSSTQDAVVNRVVDLNPEEVASVEILKGAAAAAIYGSKASNGVVIITTKRGRPGAPRFSFTQRVGTFDLSEKLGFRTFETVDEAFAAFLDPDESAAADTADLRAVYGDGTHFDFEELLAGRNELSYESALQVSGGNESTQYYVSGLVKNDEGIIDNTGFEKQSLRLNLSQKLGDRFDLSVNTNLLHTLAQRGLTNNDNSGTSFYMVFPFTPSYVDLRPRADGTFPNNPAERSNPLQTAALMQNDEDVWRFLGAANLTARALITENHDLRFILNGGADYFSQENELNFPPALQFEPLDGQPGTALLSNANNLNLNLGLNAVYTFRPDAGNWSSTSTIGFQHEDRDLEISRIVSRNLTGGFLQVDAGTNVNVFAQRQRTKDQGIFLQEELLLLQERLLLTGAVRADRSSNNGDHDKFFYYPKAAVAYRFVDPTGWLEHLKLRGAFGQSGNQPLFGQKFTPLDASQNIAGLPGLVVPGVFGDDALEPERQTEYEVGFDANLFNSRAGLEFTFYQKFISDLILERESAPSTGFTTEIFNGGEMETHGFEVALSATPFQRQGFNWSTRATFFTDESEVTDLPIPAFRTGGFGTALGAFEIREGRSATQIVGTVTAGDSTFVARVGDANPDFKVGFTNDLSWKGVNLYFLLDWQKGGDVINLTKLLSDFGRNTVDFDKDPQFVSNIGPVEVNDTLTAGQRRITGFGVEVRPYVEDASYVKLREAALSWTLPARWVSGIWGSGVDRVRLTVTGRNLLTFTDYTGLDPEVSNFGNQPIARNIDVAPFPPSRSFWLSVDLNF